VEYKDYYKVLGVSKQATAQEIKSAYRSLARKHHPDLHPGDKKSEERFKEINEAHEVLGDPGKRKKYDELGANWEEILRNREYASQYAAPGAHWQGTDAFDLNDFFETFFGGGESVAGRRRGARARSGRGDDLVSPVELTLEEAYHGTSRRLQIETGPRAQKAPRSVQVKIPRGVTDGSRVRLAGQGGPGVGGGPPGDLYLEVRLRPHRLFRVDGHDLSCELPVRDDEAALGATVDAPTLEGRVSVKIPPGSQSGSHLRLKEKGVPHLHGAGRGDLYYTLKIVTPAALTVEEKELIQQLRELREQQGARANPRHALFS
jgi:curved DNA-binding protein